MAKPPAELVRVMKARQELLTAQDGWWHAVAAAKRAGHGYGAIAAVAGVSRQAIAKMLHGSRAQSATRVDKSTKQV